MMGTMPGVVQTEEIKRTRTLGNEEADDQMEVQKRCLEDKWTELADAEYPDLLHKIVFVPPVHINKLTDDRSDEGRAGEVTRVETKLSDFRDDGATLQVLRFIWRISEQLEANEKKTVMAILSKYILENYLDKRLSGASGQKKKGRRGKKVRDNDPRAREFFPTPTDPKLVRGEFDLLIMHKKYGFFSMEAKAIGDLKEETRKSLSDEIMEVLIQLNKRHRQLDNLTEDLGDPKIPVTKLPAFPNLKRSQLQEALEKPNFKGTPEEVERKKVSFQTELQKYLGNDLDLSKALNLWLCQDEVTPENAGVEMTWWKQLEEHMEAAEFPGISDDNYKRIFGRFWGPHSTVEVCRYGGQIQEARSIGDAVQIMGEHFDRFVLTEEQRKWRSSQEPLVYFTGPPGSGKTLLMLLKAVLWAQEGDTVVIVRGPGNLPGHLVSQDLHKKIVNTVNDESLAANIRLETVTAWTDPATFVDEMVKNSATDGDEESKVRFLVDELWLAKPTPKFLSLARDVVELLQQAKASVAGPPRTSGDLPSFAEVSASEPMSPEKVTHAAETRDQLSEALGCILQKEEKWKAVHGIVNVVLGDEKVKEQLTNLFSVTRDLWEALSTDAGHQQVPMSKVMVENVENAQFYVSVLESWLASPVLHQVMQEVRRYPETAGLWCTGFWANRCPEGYTLTKLSRSLRCPPHVQDLLDKTEHLASHQDIKQYAYQTTSTQTNPPLAAEGPPCATRTYINHGKHARRVHHDPSEQTAAAKLKCISQCEDCGLELARVLKDKLCVGKKSQYRDVLIVSRALLPIKPDSVFMQALEKSGIPVIAVVRGSEDLKEGDLESNSVLMSNTYNSHGLERIIVVFIPDISCCSEPDKGCHGNLGDGGGVDGGDGGCSGGAVGGDDFGYDDAGFRFDFDSKMMGVGNNNRMGIWFIASRCLAHVVMFHV